VHVDMIRVTTLFQLFIFGVRVVLGIFAEKTPKLTWLCTGISPLLFGLRTWSKC